jgi:hypothetical protein
MQETLVTPLVSRGRKEQSWEHFTFSISLHSFHASLIGDLLTFYASISDSSMRIR